MNSIHSLIGISGKFVTGKSTLATNLALWDNRYHIVSLADALKDDIASISRVPRSYLDANKEVFRETLQKWGTGVMRHIWGQDVWVQRLEEYCVNMEYTHVIVPDVRFANELWGLGAMSEESFFFRLRVPHDELVERYTRTYGHPPSAEALAHPSETALDALEGTPAFNMVLDTSVTTPETTAYLAASAMGDAGYDFWLQEPKSAQMRSNRYVYTA